MSESAFTPGPWSVEKIEGAHHSGFKIIGGPDPLTSICTITGMQEARADGGWTGANAHLIAAAPDLLAALQALLVQLRGRDLGYLGIKTDHAHDAIDKATGAA